MAEKNADWTKDELILALALYMQFEGNPPRKGSQEVIELSALLNSMGKHLHNGKDDFRNPNGVYMKVMNFRRFDPKYVSQGKVGLQRGNKLEEVVWKDFADDAQKLLATANAIKRNVASPESAPMDEEEDSTFAEAAEGRVLTRVHIYKERSRKLVERKKADALSTHGKLNCEACAFDFEECYGERGAGFIEAHHTKPVTDLAPGSITRIEDLVLLCANCHRMIHAKKPWLTVAELKNAIKALKK